MFKFWRVIIICMLHYFAKTFPTFAIKPTFPLVADGALPLLSLQAYVGTDLGLSL
jgi:hypothetical protein